MRRGANHDGLSERDEAALAFIAHCVRFRKRSPSLMEIAAALNLRTKGQAERVVTNLRRHRLITRTAKRIPHSRAPSLHVRARGLTNG